MDAKDIESSLGSPLPGITLEVSGHGGVWSVTATWKGTNRLDSPEMETASWKGPDDPVRAARWLRRHVVPKAKADLDWRAALALYRQSSLLPPHVCRDVGSMLDEFFGHGWTKDRRRLAKAAKFAMDEAWHHLLARPAKCPHCGCHDCWEGCGGDIRCQNCGATWSHAGACWKGVVATA